MKRQTRRNSREEATWVMAAAVVPMVVEVEEGGGRLWVDGPMENSTTTMAGTAAIIEHTHLAKDGAIQCSSTIDQTREYQV